MAGKQATSDSATDPLSTRERILEVALEVFAERGLHGATMTEIAKRAGLTGGALYRYFPSKEEVFKAVVDSRSTAFSALDMVKGLIPELEPRTALNFIAQGMFAFFSSQVDFMRVVVGESVKDPARSEPFFDKMLRPAHDFIVDCIVLWKDKGLLRKGIDPDIATAAFLGTIGFSLIERGLLQDDELCAMDLGDLTDQLTGIFLSGVLKTSSAQSG
jgi:AcrR family transcriptional regulator